MSVDEFSTTRATWDVFESWIVQDKLDPVPDKLVASFMDYQDCYVFMKGIAVANGHLFSDWIPSSRIKSQNGHKEYFIKSRDVYIGKKRT